MPYAGLLSFVTARSDGAITARVHAAMYWREITGSLVNTANSLLFITVFGAFYLLFFAA